MNSHSQRKLNFTAVPREPTAEVPSRRGDLIAVPNAATVPTMKAVAPTSDNQTGDLANCATMPMTPPAMVSHMEATSARLGKGRHAFRMSFIVLTVADECSLALMPLSRLARGRSRSDPLTRCRVYASQPPAGHARSYGRLHVRFRSPRHSRRS